MHAAPGRIAVFRALQLGDMLCAVPALRALRDRWPQARITLIGLPWARDFVRRYATLLDDWMHFPGAVGFPEQIETDAGLPEFYRQARARRFDLAIQLHGSGGAANDIVLGLGAPSNAGFTNDLDAGKARPGCFMPWPDALPEPERYATLMEFMGVPVHDRALWFPVSNEDRIECRALLRVHGIRPERAVIMHAGSQLPSRRWPPERFAAAADALAGEGWRILLTGTAGEAALIAQVQAAMTLPSVNLAGVTTLGGLAALVQAVPLIVCNDTGISHIAAALGTPSVVVACGSDTRRWAPADTRRHVVLADHPACRPCAHPICPTGHECARNVQVEAVIAAARSQLALPEGAGEPCSELTWA